MATFKWEEPQAGERIVVDKREAQRSRQSDHSVYRRGRHRSRYLGGGKSGSRCRRGEGLQGKEEIAWYEVFAGEKAYKLWRMAAGRYADGHSGIHRGHQGAADHAGGRRIRSLNVALRQELDLYVCLRPVRYFDGVPSPVKHPELVDMVIFRENTEDIYAGIEWRSGIGGSEKSHPFPAGRNGRQQNPLPGNVRHRHQAGISEGTKRLVRAAIEYACEHGRKSVTLVHKGNIMKFTEGAFKNWGYEWPNKNSATRCSPGPI